MNFWENFKKEFLSSIQMICQISEDDDKKGKGFQGTKGLNVENGHKAAVVMEAGGFYPKAQTGQQAGKDLDHDRQPITFVALRTAERQQGTIQFRGPSSFKGYYRRPDATDRLLEIANEHRDSGAAAAEKNLEWREGSVAERLEPHEDGERLIHLSGLQFKALNRLQQLFLHSNQFL